MGKVLALLASMSLSTANSPLPITRHVQGQPLRTCAFFMVNTQIL